MSNNSSNTKRIAKNTIFLYFRMLFLMFISFYTSRVVLQNLGVEDFGIQNVVGGLASMFVFFRSSLSNVTQRYLNYELGHKDIKAAEEVFCLHQTIYFIIALVVVVLAETVGLWFVYNKLVIPEARLTAAVYCYHFTVISMAITILSVVYDSAIIAHENMKVYSYVGIFEGLFKLGIAFVIALNGFDRLIMFQFLHVMLALLVRLFYGIYCKKRYEECVFHFYWNKKKFLEASGMVGWNTLGTLVFALNDQGINILLNLFFGPAVNAARAVSFQVSHAVTNFGSNFMTSVRPQIVKSYAAKDWDYLYKLFYSSSKYSFLLLWVICLPVMLCIDVILDIWLTTVPEYANIFTIWVLLYSLVNILNQPIWSLSLAVGKLKYYILIGSGVFLMAFPIAYVCLKLGCPPTSVFITMFIVRMIYIMVVFSILRTYVELSITKYLRFVILPCILIASISGVSCYLISIFIPHNILGCVILGSISLIINATCIWMIGLSNDERILVMNKLLKRK